jgi:hypothetical protein
MMAVFFYKEAGYLYTTLPTTCSAKIVIPRQHRVDIAVTQPGVLLISNSNLNTHLEHY